MENKTEANTRNLTDFVTVSRNRLRNNFLACGLACMVVGHGLGNGWIQRGIGNAVEYFNSRASQEKLINYSEVAPGYFMKQEDLQNMYNSERNKE